MQARRRQSPPAPGLLRLFVAGDSQNSRLARQNLDAVLAEMPKAARRLEVVDVFQDYSAALAERVLVTPTLTISRAGHQVRIIGTLEDADLLRQALGIIGHG